MASIKVYFENVKQEEYLSSNDFYQVKDAVKFCEGSWYSSTTSKWSLDLTERTLEKLKFYMQKDKYDKYKEMLIKIQKVEVPQQFSFLYEFQKEGIKKLSARKILLCDEVGLGKTLQTAAFCEIMKFEKILIVVPAPLKYQWKEELLKHFNQESTIWEGTFLERKKIFNNFSMSSIKYFIINYEQLVNKNAFLNEEKWDFIILDEVHRVKNNKSIANKFVRKEFKGIRKVGLTATPLVNNLRELFTIANLLSDNTFMSWPTFENAFCVREIIHRRNPKTHDIEELNVIVNYKNTENFYKKLSPFMIRRKKNEVLAELPTRIYKEIRFDLNEIEKKKHGEFIELAKNAWKNDDAENILKYITHARQCCNSLEILPDELKVDAASSKIDALKAELEEIDDKVLILRNSKKWRE